MQFADGVPVRRRLNGGNRHGERLALAGTILPPQFQKAVKRNPGIVAVGFKILAHQPDIEQIDPRRHRGVGGELVVAAGCIQGGIDFPLVLGTGKTAVKANMGRYLEAAQNGGLFIASRPSGRLQTTTTRSWTDANKNFVADCDLLNGAQQDLRSTGGDFCGANAIATFGKPVFDTTQDPTLLSGWGIRSP